MPKGDGKNSKYREMTPAEWETAFYRHERDAIHRDWIEAEKVIDAARALLSEVPPSTFPRLQACLSIYDAYIAEEKAKAKEPSGLPERGLVST